MPSNDDKHKMKKEIQTTVIFKTSSSSGGVGEIGGGGGSFGGVQVGDQVNGGGTVVAVNGSSITVTYPDGVPDIGLKLPRRYKLLIYPQNTSTCDCAIHIVSLDKYDRPIIGSELVLPPGQSVLKYERAPGALAIAIACSKGCGNSSCEGGLKFYDRI